MHSQGHIGAGLIGYSLIALPLVTYGYYSAATISLIIILATTKIPDWDWWLPFVKHRGLTHTLLFAILFGLFIAGGFAGAMIFYYESLEPFLVFDLTTRNIILVSIFGFINGFVSIMSHLLADVVTPMGLKPLRPFSKKRYGVRIAKAANPVANGVFLLLGFISTVLAWLAGLYISGVITPF